MKKYVLVCQISRFNDHTGNWYVSGYCEKNIRAKNDAAAKKRLERFANGEKRRMTSRNLSRKIAIRLYESPIATADIRT